MAMDKPQANSLDNVKPYFDEYADLRRAKERIEARMKELDPLVRPALDGKGAVIHNGYMFELRTNKGRKSYDYKAMAADGINVEDYAKVGAPSTSLYIKQVNEA